MTSTAPDTPLLSIIVPLHDEEENVLPCVEELVPHALEIDPAFEVLLVDDGSRDATAERIEDARRRWPLHVRHISHPRNQGQTAALDSGFRYARGTLLAMMDGDLQPDPADLAPMVRALQENDVDLVHGWRRHRRDRPFKRLQTRIANGIRNRLTRSSVRDTGCPLKVFRREVLDQIKLYTGLHRFLVTLAQLEGFRTLEIPVNHRPRIAGRSKYGAWNRMGRALRDLFAVRWMMSRHIERTAGEITTRSSDREDTESA